MSEDDLDTFEGWLEGIQGIDPTTAAPEVLADWRDLYDELNKNPTPKVGRIKFKPLRPGEDRYAVAIREGSDLWLTFWVRRAPKGDIFLIAPRADRRWDPHTSYHRDGTFHAKSFDRRLGPPRKRQSLTAAFRGTEHIGTYGGHGKGIGAICDAEAFSGVVEVPPGVLGPLDGAIAVDLVEPGVEPMPWPFRDGRIVRQATFKDGQPWIVLRVGSTPLPRTAA